MFSRVCIIHLYCVLKKGVVPQTFRKVGFELKVIDCRQNRFRYNGYIITVITEVKLSKKNDWGLNTLFSEE